MRAQPLAPVFQIWGQARATARASNCKKNINYRANFTHAGGESLYPASRQQDWIPFAMNASPEMNFDDLLRVKLAVLQREHRDLDEAVHALETLGRPDVLTLRRLKKQKLALKDQITRIEDKLIPNIIA